MALLCLLSWFLWPLPLCVWGLEPTALPPASPGASACLDPLGLRAFTLLFVGLMPPQPSHPSSNVLLSQTPDSQTICG